MANWTQEDGAPKSVTNPADVSTIAQISSGNVSAPVPCLIPSFADAVKLLSARYSCLVLDSRRKHVALPPLYLRKKRTGIQEELNAELLKYSSSLKGVPMAYDDIKVVGQHGDIHDDQGFIHFNIEASFVVFKPKKGSKDHVLCMIMKKHAKITIHCKNNIKMQYIDLTSKFRKSIDLRNKCVVTNNNFLIFRVQELVAQTEQKESTTEPESTEDTIDSPKPKKKKKKDKSEKESLNDSGLEEMSENHQTADDTAEIDSNANGHHKEKKKKKKDRGQESDEILPSELSTSDSSRYMSDKTSRKRAAESHDGLQDAPAAKKKKKSK
uniref:DNA-directed RNA polymerase subunit n=1 Tax=Cyprinus carpio carpio TaxID=630221 RepID=A0A8C1EIW0_CYPCA